MQNYRRRGNRDCGGLNILRLPSFAVYKCAVTLPVSTRAVGLYTQAVFSKVHSIYRNIPLCTPWAFYRVSLGQLELKLLSCSNTINAGQDEFFYRPQLDGEFKDMIMTAPANIALINNLIHTVGNFEHKGTNFYVRPIAHPTLGILLSNLRQVVTSMANAHTPVQIRREFYENNPLPYAEWTLPFEDDERRRRRVPAGAALGNPNHPLLLNADQIMPPEYSARDLGGDINSYRTFISHLCRKNYLSMLSGPCVIDYDGSGQRHQFTSNYMGDLKNPYTLRPDVGDYANQPPIGDLDEFWSTETLDANEMTVGALHLLGEIPNAPVTSGAQVIRCEYLARQRARYSYTALLSTYLY